MTSWIRTTETIGGYPSIKHRYSQELCLAGPRGEIWVYGEGRYRAVLKPGSFQTAALRLVNAKGRASRTDELIVSFPASLLNAFVALLKVPKQQARQISYAETFPTRS